MASYNPLRPLIASHSLVASYGPLVTELVAITLRNLMVWARPPPPKALFILEWSLQTVSLRFILLYINLNIQFPARPPQP